MRFGPMQMAYGPTWSSDASTVRAEKTRLQESALRQVAHG